MSQVQADALFRGWKIWIAQRVPQRSVFVSKVVEHGGEIVPLEKFADIMIADHLRKDVPPDTYSYTWLEQCVAQQQIVSKEDHRAGPSSASMDVRPAGSYRPSKTGRNPFSAEDDKVLYKWVTEHEKQGALVLGNEIYKQLERINNRHPWQSWRDRWIKYVSQRPPPPLSVSQETPPTPPSDDNNIVQPEQQQEPTETSTVTPNIPQTRLRAFRPPPQDTPLAPGPTSSIQPENLQSIATPPLSTKPTKLNPSQRSKGTISLTADQDPVTPAGAFSQQESSNHSKNSVTPGQGQAYESPNSSSRKVSKRPFSVDEYQFLVDNTANIQTTTVESYSTVWYDARIFDLDRHSAEEWKEYYETKILPLWKKLPRDIKQKRLSDVYIRRDSEDDFELFHGSQSLSTAEQQPPKELGSSASQKRKRDKDIIDISDDSDSRDSSKRRRKDPVTLDLPASSPITTKQKKSRVSFTENIESPSEQANEELDPIGVLLTGAEPDHTSAEFSVFEDREIPEDEKENVVVDEAGSYSIPPRHIHIRSSEALEAFSDPLPQFTLLDHSQQPFNEDNDVLSLLYDKDDNLLSVRPSNTIISHEDEVGEPEPTYQEHINDNDSLAEQIINMSSPGFASQIDFDKGIQVPDSVADVVYVEEEIEQEIYDDNRDQENDQEDGQEEDEEDTFETMPSQRNSQRLRNRSIEAEEVEVEMIEQVEIDSGSNSEAGQEVLDRFYDGLKQQPETANTQNDGGENESEDGNESITQNPNTIIQSLFVSSPPSSSPRRHPTVSHITLRKDLRPSNPATPSQPSQQTAPIHSSPSLQQNTTRPQSQSSASSETQTQKSLDHLNNFMEEQTRTGTHSKSTVLYALQRANLDPNTARVILDLLARGQTLPKNVQGIWTEDHDAELLDAGPDAPVSRLEAIHGSKGVRLRREALSAWGHE